MLTMQSIADFIVCTALCNSAAITLYTCEHTIHVYRRSREPCTYCVRKKMSNYSFYRKISNILNILTGGYVLIFSIGFSAENV